MTPRIRSCAIIVQLLFAVCGPLSLAYGNDVAIFADNIGRKTLEMARKHHPGFPVITEAIKIRPEGEIIHGYSRLKWYSKYLKHPHTSEIYWSMTDHPGKRRIFRLIYDDDQCSPCRVQHHNEVYLKQLNHEIFKHELVDGGLDFEIMPVHWQRSNPKPDACCNCHVHQ